jgi:hypothetical protein
MRVQLVLSSAVFGALLLFSRCFDTGGRDPRGRAYADAASCAGCHASIVNSYAHTPHSHSAGLASFNSIRGSFAGDSNTVVVNDSVRIVMEIRRGAPYQVLYVWNKETRAQRFDVVFGYEKGQGYLYWKDDRLYQLPIFYFTALHRWTTSPGNPPGTLSFDRPVDERCFECHTSFVSASHRGKDGALDRGSLIENIDCQRCHGPAANHVAFHTENPGEKIGRYMVSYRNLNRRQKIDQCAVCHSGSNQVQLKSLFAFRPGDSLSHFALPAPVVSDRPDVHGDQVALLASSKCFRNSEMDCSTCHNTHVNDLGDRATYAQRCQTCHSEFSQHFCKLADGTNTGNTVFLKQNCTRCHMPMQASDVFKVKSGESDTHGSIFLTNHRIAVYPAASKKILDSFIDANTPRTPTGSQMRRTGFVRDIKRIASPHVQLPSVYTASATHIKNVEGSSSETAVGSLPRWHR